MGASTLSEMTALAAERQVGRRGAEARVFWRADHHLQPLCQIRSSNSRQFSPRQERPFNREDDR